MTGVDLSARMIGPAQDEEHRAPLGIRYARASYTDMALFASATFDAVVSFMAMMDGPRFDLAMAECFRVLRPGGRSGFASLTRPPRPPSSSSLGSTAPSPSTSTR